MSLEQFILTANLKTLAEGLKNKEFTAAELTAAYLNRTKEKKRGAKGLHYRRRGKCLGRC